MKKLYLMSCGAQKKLIDKYCFKKCGKILVGGIDLMGGHFVCCRESHCPYQEKLLDMGEVEVFSKKEHIIVRKLLKDKKHE